MMTEELEKAYECLCAHASDDDKNLFEMASLKEFRHSAILGYLLSRKEGGRLRNLEALLQRVLPLADGEIDAEGAKVECERMVECDGRKRPVDVLCRFKNKALIIENKCRNAVDQERQIADYWAGVKAIGYDEKVSYEDKDIYVLYLPPMNDIKSPSALSVGTLDFDGKLAGHLIVRSYRSLILPWLKNDVLPNTGYRNGILINSLKSYIDVLEGAFGERSEHKDARSMLKRELADCLLVTDDSGLWDTTTTILEKIDFAITEEQKRGFADAQDNEIRRLTELQAALWNVRSLLREGKPLLDPDNLIYEVYWMLRNNPTPFAAKYMGNRVDAGLFFRSGRKGSIWDSCLVGDGDGVTHTAECVCDSLSLIRFLSKDEEGGDALCFGIGGLDANAPLIEQLRSEQGWSVDYDASKSWTKVVVDDEFLYDAREKTGGDQLWAIASAVSKQARRFSDLVCSGGFALIER